MIIPIIPTYSPILMNSCMYDDNIYVKDSNFSSFIVLNRLTGINNKIQNGPIKDPIPTAKHVLLININL